MKPRIFIGTPQESLKVGYAIQDNLSREATITVWSQNIFELSSNSLNDLLKALDNFDFGIFVFTPEDTTFIRNEKFNTVRDNLIFELGLFMGKLGKGRVFFVHPQNIEDYHLPTDLLGVKPGLYDDKREDDNLQAALAPFCNQVRERIKNFAYENLVEMANESDEAKRLAIEKPRFWEHLLAAELMETKMKLVNKGYDELIKGIVFKRTHQLSASEFTRWVADSAGDFQNLMNVFKKVFEEELVKSFGPLGVPGNVQEIKSVVEKIISLFQNLLDWEHELIGISPPDDMVEAKKIMTGWTKVIIDTFNECPSMIRSALEPEKIASGKPVIIKLTFPPPSNVDKLKEFVESYKRKLQERV